MLGGGWHPTDGLGGPVWGGREGFVPLVEASRWFQDSPRKSSVHSRVWAARSVMDRMSMAGSWTLTYSVGRGKLCPPHRGGGTEAAPGQEGKGRGGQRAPTHCSIPWGWWC